MRGRFGIIAVMISLLVCSFSAVTVCKGAVTSGEFEYENYDGSLWITRYTGSEVNLVVPSSINGIPVVGISERFYHCPSLRSVVLQEGISEMSMMIFWQCTALTSVTLPDSIGTIPDWAFFNCTSLTSISFGKNVTRIGHEAFYNCSSLTSITIPENVSSIGYSAFQGCSKLTQVSIPSKVNDIGSAPFAYCSDLASIEVDANNPAFRSVEGVLYRIVGDLPVTYYLVQCPSGKTGDLDISNQATDVGDWAFAGCHSLTSVTISDSVGKIGLYAFAGCIRLTSMTIPSGVQTIFPGAFSDCSSLTSINVEDGSSKYASFDGVLYLNTMSWLIQCPGGKTNVTIRQDTIGLGGDAFRGCTSLTAIVIPEGVAEIGDGAFYGCTGLTSIAIPDAVRSLGTTVFLGCSNLTNVELENDLKDIPAFEFSYCTSLVSIAIPESVTKIGVSAFEGCIALASLTLPANLSILEDGSFHGCSSLASIVIPENVSSIGVLAFGACPSLSTIIFNGDAPEVAADPYTLEPVDYVNGSSRSLIVYYLPGALGFSTPLWCGEPTVPLPMTPTAPLRLSTVSGNGEVNLSWAAPASIGDSPIDHYIVYQDGIEIKNVASMNATLTGLETNVSYSFKVCAHNSAGNGSNSSTITIMSRMSPSWIAVENDRNQDGLGTSMVVGLASLFIVIAISVVVILFRRHKGQGSKKDNETQSFKKSK